jgi:hypothetical protein
MAQNATEAAPGVEFDAKARSDEGVEEIFPHQHEPSLQDQNEFGLTQESLRFLRPLRPFASKSMRGRGVSIFRRVRKKRLCSALALLAS